MGGPRVPKALQKIFLMAQRGHDVDKPPEGLGSKVFPHKYSNRRKRGPRIPAALQKIFLRSQKGEDVVEAPKNGVATKTFDGFVSDAESSVATATLQKHETAAQASRRAIKSKRKETKKEASLDSPQAFLDKELTARGYSTRKYCSLETAYFNRPTEYQMASYGSVLKAAVCNSDAVLLQKLLSTGLSPNPCNTFGESLVHMVCRKGDHKVLQVLLRFDCSLQVTDDFGKTPLHDACWRAQPSFDTLSLILGSDRDLVNILDTRGSSPLSYIRRENYAAYIDFFRSKMDRFWPRRDVAVEGEELPPLLCARKPHSMPIRDPPGALTMHMAKMVSNGQIPPEDILGLADESDSDTTSYITYSSRGASTYARSYARSREDYDDDSFSDSDSDNDSDGSYYSDSDSHEYDSDSDGDGDGDNELYGGAERIRADGRLGAGVGTASTAIPTYQIRSQRLPFKSQPQLQRKVQHRRVHQHQPQKPRPAFLAPPVTYVSNMSYLSDDSDYSSDDFSDYYEDKIDNDELREFSMRAGGPLAVARRCIARRQHAQF